MKRAYNFNAGPSAMPEEVLKDLCDLAYRLILEKLPKYVQKEIVEVTG